MARQRYRFSKKKVGTSPGTLLYVGREPSFETKSRRIEYNEKEYRIEEGKNLKICAAPDSVSPHLTWLAVDGIHETKGINYIGEQYHLHPLVLEDILNTQQKPKAEQYEKYLFVTMKMLYFNTAIEEVENEQVSFIVGSNYLISFQENHKTDCFQPVVSRIQASAGKTRRNGTDYLLYALMDLVVDQYFVVLEGIGEKLETIESRIMEHEATRLTQTNLYTLKRELTLMRKHVWPLRDMLSNLILEDSPLIQSSTILFLRDLADHVAQVIDIIDSYRELATSLVDVYLTTLSHRMNSVMKTLTIITTVFMPLSFVSGIYGMNFEYMPELHSPYGYYITLGVMAVVAAGLVFYFRRQGWM